MNNRRLITCSLGLALTVLPAVAQAADTPAVAVVRQFLAARAAHRYSEAYRLLSAGTRKGLSKKEFCDGISSPGNTAQQLSAPLVGVAALLLDTHDILHYTFVLIGPDPHDPDSALVRAVPPAGSHGIAPVVLRVVTTVEPVSHAPRLDATTSLNRASPEENGLSPVAARREESQSNLKQIGLGIIVYSEDHGERMPDSARWVDEIMPYVKDTAPFHDPSAPSSQRYCYAFQPHLVPSARRRGASPLQDRPAVREHDQ